MIPTRDTMATVAFGLLARNCGRRLKRNIRRIENVRKKYPDSIVVVVENDSRDNTPRILKDWAKRSPGVIVDSFRMKGFDFSTHGKHAGRIERMAYLRNRLMDDISEAGWAERVVILDPDVLRFDEKALCDAIAGMGEGEGGVFANGYKLYKHGRKIIRARKQFDVYAFMAEDETLEDIKRMFSRPGARARLRRRAKWMDKEIRQRHELPCRSAFNALAVYNGEAIKGLRYDVISAGRNRVLCEHVHFNDRVCDRGYSCRVDENLRVVYKKTHAGIVKFLWHKLMG